MLTMYARLLHAQSDQSFLHRVNHRVRPAQEVRIDTARIEQLAPEHADLCSIETSVEQLHVLRLSAHEEVQRQALRILILQRQQLLGEHDRSGRAVAIEKQEAAPGLVPKHVPDDAENRSDTAAARESAVRARSFGVWRDEETSGRRQHFQLVAHAQRAAEMTGHAATLVQAHADAQM